MAYHAEDVSGVVQPGMARQSVGTARLVVNAFATDEASPEILKTLGIAERISSVQKQ
jgi:hypothetical protein